ncbi:thioredoxin domain-containing protein [Lutibacter citreus]|uniref:thioredoxin domain-containing protein n=1 Tax=Lutibacter citreus TaxID=2138210 RepID=UPI000DBE7750|nr:thioredoxin domain-containing protein [Lutibacter citreus]
MKQVKQLIGFLFIVNLMSTTIVAQGVKFEHGSLNEAIEKAKTENKIVFIDCYTTWCGPCKWMTKEIFPQKEVGDFFNENFVSLKLDCEKGEGIYIAKKYGVQAYPTLLFVDINGEILHKIVGGKSAEDLVSGAQNALDPNKRISVASKKYDEGERELNFVLNYIDLLDVAYEKVKSEKVSKALVSSLPIEKFGNKEMFKVLANSNVAYNSKEYNYVLKNQEELLTKEVDSMQYFSVLGGAIRHYLNKVAESCNNLEELNAAIEKCKQDYVSNYQDNLEKNLVYSYYLSKKEFNKWFDVKLEEADKLKETPQYVYVIHDIGDQVVKNPKFEGSKESLEKALEIGHSLVNDNNDGLIMGNFLLAKLYLKKGDKEKALNHFNIFFKTNEEAGGTNAHPSISRVINAIESL